MLCANKEHQYFGSPYLSIPKQTNDKRTDSSEWPPAVLPTHPFRIALHSLCCWLQTGFLSGHFCCWDSGVLPRWIRPCRRSVGLRFCRLCCLSCFCPGSFWPWAGERCGREDHLRVIGWLPAHVRFDLPGSLAGVVELPQLPHHLDEVVPGVFIVGAAHVRLPHILTPVWVPVALAWHPQLGVFPLPSDGHCAQVLVLGVECDGIIPDALSSAAITLSLSRPNIAGEKQQSADLCPHGVRWMLNLRGECTNWGSLLLFIGQPDREGKVVRLNGTLERGTSVTAVWREQMLNQLEGRSCLSMWHIIGVHSVSHEGISKKSQLCQLRLT